MFESGAGSESWAARVAVLERTSLAAIDDDALTDFLSATERVTAWAQGQQLLAIRELTRRRAGERHGPEFLADEVATELTLSRRAGEARVALATDLTDRLPGTFAALSAGRIDLAKARALSEIVMRLPDAAAAAVETKVLPRAPEQTVAELRRSARRVAIAVDPRGAEERHTDAVAERRVIVTPQADGMAALWALLPATGAMAVKTALDGLARAAKTPGDGRTADQRRADALVDVFTGVLDHGELPRERRGRPHVTVTLPASTLLDGGSEPGELVGYGPITADMARTVASRGTWRCVTTDPEHGTVSGCDTGKYVPPAALARLVAARDGTCRFPGCGQPATRCDLDHRTPWPDGPTSECNLITLCRHHHRLKHETQWMVESSDRDGDPPGTVIWTSPSGRRYTDRPPQLPAGDAPPGPDPPPF